MIYCNFLNKNQLNIEKNKILLYTRMSSCRTRRARGVAEAEMRLRQTQEQSSVRDETHESRESRLRDAERERETGAG